MFNNYWLSGMMGLVTGDALGIPVQFMSRKEIKNRANGFVLGMEAGGVFDMPKGTWSDDSSMSLATLDSILECGKLDAGDVMIKFVEWELKGEYTPFGEPFDQGNTCTEAIYKFMNSPDVRTCGKTGEMANGNGALMRILPVCLYYYGRQSMFKADMTKEIIDGIDAISSLTHNHVRSKMACGLYYFVVREILDGLNAFDKVTSHFDKVVADAYPNEVLIGPRPVKPELIDLIQEGIDRGLKYYGSKITNLTEMSRFGRVFHLDEFAKTSVDDIKSSGYVIDSIEAAIWCLITTSNYKECMLKAVNLGDDTDTIAAIAGGLAGLYYGYEEIPSEWLECIQRREWIEELCHRADSNILGIENCIADIHMHVIPNVDDGSQSMEKSMEMLRESYLQGVRKVFCTPHGGVVYYYDKCEEAKEHFKELLCRCAAEMPDLELRYGAEVRMFPDEMEDIVSMLDDGIMPTLGDTKYVLAEFMNSDMTFEQIKSSAKKLIDSNYLPIIAHVERYYTVIPDVNAAKELHDLGCYFQINSYSIMEESNKAIKDRTKELLDAGLVDFIGTDAHNTTYRAPMMIRGVKYLYEHYDKEYVDRIVSKNALRI